MKKIVFLMLMIILLLTLCGCNSMSAYEENKVEGTRFIIIDRYNSGHIVMDSETNVEYWISKGKDNCGTLTMLVDENGNPKVRK